MRAEIRSGSPVEPVGRGVHGRKQGCAMGESDERQGKVITYVGTDRPVVFRQAIHACRNWGLVSVVGIYGGYVDKLHFGSAMNRGVTIKTGQTPVQRYLPLLLSHIEEGRFDPTFVITRKGRLKDGPDLYRAFHDKPGGGDA